MTDKRPTERFTSRVESYVRYRPDYPAGILPLLQEHTGLARDWSIADIGSGPGNLTRLFLDAGYTVTGVEPNDAMREAGDDILGGYSNFASVKGTAEATTLTDHGIDLITAGQAFHWFDPPKARIEFLRILKTGGWVALIWNRRAEGESAFLDDYHEMMQRYSTEFDQVVVRDQTADDGMSILFGTDNYSKFTLPHDQALDAEAFWGRLISSSYTPLPGEPGHDEIRARSTEIFDQYSSDGVLRYPYETQIYLGRPGGTQS